MRTLTTRSTFRPPPFISVERDSGYPLPTHPFRSHHHTPAPTHASRTSFDTPSPFLSSLADDVSTLLDVTSFRDGGRKDLVAEHSADSGPSRSPWANFSDVNITTSLLTSAVTSSASQSQLPDNSSVYYPAGYPSGYTWPHIIISSVVVTIIIVIIVFGNFLVMWAIVRDKNLKGTQNYFIWSLALADFLLGLLIVPFSLANELMGYWHFGPVLCELWKATDVLLCTASISSLCLISLDRYWSITKAIHYSRQRTPKRAAIMIFVVWFVSAAVCIPPLIGWSQNAPEDAYWPTCALSEDIGYVLYSSMGSFYIPAFIMVFVYFKIYQAAKARARKNVSKAPRSALSERSGEQKNSTESSGTDHQQHHHHHNHEEESMQDCQHFQHQQLLQQQRKTQEPVSGEEKFGKQLKVHPLQSSSVDEASMEEVALTPTTVTLTPGGYDARDGGEEGDGRSKPPARHSTPCRCANEILSDSLTATGVTSDGEEEEEEEARSTSRQLLQVRTRSLSLPCRPSHACHSDELTKLIATTDSDSCDALGPASAAAAGPAALNLMDFGRFGFSYSMPTTTTTDTDSSLDLVTGPPSSRPQRLQPTYNSTERSLSNSGVANCGNNKSSSNSLQALGSGLLKSSDAQPAFVSAMSCDTVCGADISEQGVVRGGVACGDTGSIARTPVQDVASGVSAFEQSRGDEGGRSVGGNGTTIHHFRIVEPKQNGSLEVPGSGCSTPLHHQPHLQDAATKDSPAPSGLFGSLRRQLFPSHHNGKVGEQQRQKVAKSKKKKKTKKGQGKKTASQPGGSSCDNKAPDFFSAERHKRKLAKARERRATLVLGLVMAAFILCWLPFFMLYVVAAFCVDCIPRMVFTVFFWIGYANSALNPIIYTVFNRDFRRAFARILCGRRRFGR